jgi:hypothetical protein
VIDGSPAGLIDLTQTVAEAIRMTSLSRETKERSTVSIEADANQDLALDDEDAENVVGGQNKAKKAVKAVKPAPAAEVDTTVQASGGGWQPVVDDPSEDC